MAFKKIIFVSVILIAIIFAFIFLMPRWESHRMEKRGNKIVVTIEQFKTEHGRLPESLQEMGLVDDMHTQPFYTKLNQNEYELHYSWNFDRGYGYFSKTGKWRETY